MSEPMSPADRAILDYVWEHASFLLMQLDEGGSVVRLNGYAKKLFGDPAPARFEDVLVDFGGTLTLDRLMDEGNAPRLLNVKTYTGLPQRFYFMFLRADSAVLIVASTDIHDAENLRRELSNANNDLNALTRELHKKNAELEELNRLKNEFLGMAAHDLRKPVGLIWNYSEFLLEECASKLEPEQVDFLRKINERSQSMGRLIDNFLDVSVIESGRFEIRCAPTDLIEVIRRGLAIAELRAEKKGVLLSSALGEGPLAVSVDADKIEQVVSNLALNAVEHSGAGMTVTIELDSSADGVRVAVLDEGPGVPPAEHESVFRSFGRGSSGKSGGEKSSGLGLAIARKIVEGHGGEIGVTNRRGGGACFFFTLPGAG